MTAPAVRGRLQWSVIVPVLAVLVLVAAWFKHAHWAVLVVVTITLVGAVVSAVHHAEVVAHRVGEPFGSLILAVAVTVIEVGLIVMLMTSGGEGASSYARDTVFAAVMITTNGVLGLSVLVGALRQGIASFNAEGTATALATVLTLTTLGLVLPRFTNSTPGRDFSSAHLAFRSRLADARKAPLDRPPSSAPRPAAARRAAAAARARRS